MALLTPRPGQRRGVITRVDPWHAFIIGDDGETYFAYHTMFDVFSGGFERCSVGDPCVFTPIQEVTSKHRLRAIEVRYERQQRSLAE